MDHLGGISSYLGAVWRNLRSLFEPTQRGQELPQENIRGCRENKRTIVQICQKSIYSPCSQPRFFEGHPTGISGHLGTALGLLRDNSSYLGAIWLHLRTLFEPIQSGRELP